MEWIFIAAYLLSMAVIGLRGRKKTSDLTTFVVGGRKAGPWVSALAYGATYFSAVLFIGYAGRSGWDYGLWAVLIGVGNGILGAYLSWKLLAPKTREVTRRLKIKSMPQMFEKRYASEKMKLFSAAVIFVFMIPYSASVYSGLSYLCEAVLNIDYDLAMFLIAAVAAVYLVLGGYLASLASLPEAEKQALLYGSWDSFSGQVFTEWRNDPAHYQDQRWTHVIAPFAIPKHWPIWRGYDFGFSKPFSVGWYAVDEEGRLYRIKELYGCTGRPNEGLRIDPVEQARRIREAEQNDPLLRGRVIHGVADPAIFDESRGESIAAMMERGPNFLHWMPGDHTRLAGKMQMHYRLNFDGEGRPMLQVFSTCKHFIRTIPNLVYDESNVEDLLSPITASLLLTS